MISIAGHRFRLVALGACSVWCAHSPDLLASHLLGYMFNETGTVAEADGSQAMNAPTLFLENGSSNADLHSGPGTGVSGSPGDRAFVGSGFSSRGRHGSDPDGQFSADFDAIDAFTSFTLGGWFKTNAGESIGGGDRIISNEPLLFGSSGYGLRAGNSATSSGVLTLRVEGTAVSSPEDSYADQDSYVNFAVTYDGNLTANNVQFYRGTLTTPLTAVGTPLTLDQGAVANEGEPLVIGNTVASLNGFAGLLDNIRIWDNVVPLTELEALRQDDIAGVGVGVVPEPGSLALIALGSLVLVGYRRAASTLRT
jgi:hypothetical protein